MYIFNRIAVIIWIWGKKKKKISHGFSWYYFSKVSHRRFSEGQYGIEVYHVQYSHILQTLPDIQDTSKSGARCTWKVGEDDSKAKLLLIFSKCFCQYNIMPERYQTNLNKLSITAVEKQLWTDISSREYFDVRTREADV